MYTTKLSLACPPIRPTTGTRLECHGSPQPAAPVHVARGQLLGAMPSARRTDVCHVAGGACIALGCRLVLVLRSGYGHGAAAGAREPLRLDESDVRDSKYQLCRQVHRGSWRLEFWLLCLRLPPVC